jgi:uncharacterized protein (DUF2267 family)
MVNEGVLIEDIAARAPFRDQSSAVEAVRAALEKLGACLTHADAEALAEVLPAELAASVRRPRRHRVLPIEELFRHVSRREEVAFGLAVEHAETILTALAVHLPFELRGRLHGHLPHAWARFLEPRIFEPPGSPPSHGHGHTLAEGRPGSQRPLSEGAPPGAQSESVAADNPHQATKLSSAPEPVGDEPLTIARPGSANPLSEGGGPRRKD